MDIYYRPNKMEDFIELALDKRVGPFMNNRVFDNHNKALNLGPGNKQIEGAIPIGLPDWDAEHMAIPFPSYTFNEIYALHFFEHLSPNASIHILKECERVLKLGGILHIACPHAMSEMHHQDITHRSSWHEDTLRILMKNEHYSPTLHTWKMEIVNTFIAGINYRNLMVFYQLRKMS